MGGKSGQVEKWNTTLRKWSCNPLSHAIFYWRIMHYSTTAAVGPGSTHGRQMISSGIHRAPLIRRSGLKSIRGKQDILTLLAGVPVQGVNASSNPNRGGRQVVWLLHLLEAGRDFIVPFGGEQGALLSGSVIYRQNSLNKIHRVLVPDPSHSLLSIQVARVKPIHIQQLI